MEEQEMTPGWYPAVGDPPNTVRYWDGNIWQGAPQPKSFPPPGAKGTEAGSNVTTLATPWTRLSARVVDLFIVGIPVLIFNYIAWAGSDVSIDWESGTVSASSPWLFALVSYVSTFIFLGYEYYFLSTTGATIGKKLLQIKVVKETYEPLDSQTTLKRLAPSAAASLMPTFIGTLLSTILGLATIVMIFTDDRKQTPPDKIAKTVVIEIN